LIRGTEIAYKAQSPGKAAQHVKAQGSGDRVNAAVVQRKFMFLSGEACLSKVRAYLYSSPDRPEIIGEYLA
jgi:hypothetical protein